MPPNFMRKIRIYQGVGATFFGFQGVMNNFIWVILMTTNRDATVMNR